ncbi:hypothetical protein G3R49_02195 [Shewanella sp. WXL01]|uniref:hypothetical protein n=1 Tax=Shewanella sp. WXL01 TaxID=2709721 RepID=UPI0014382939|nr:hypothetical protein [Shewanella sp. WXL01]NKF49392.1 hypothetical protein [Shewanella sp. WXL01]
MPFRLRVLFIIYVLVAIGCLWRAVTFNAFDLLTIGVFPVLVGLWYQSKWAHVVLYVYISLQSLGVIAMSVVALIALQITPEDVKLEFQGSNIPLIPLAIGLYSLVIFQWWVALSKVSKQYLANDKSKLPEVHP